MIWRNNRLLFFMVLLFAAPGYGQKEQFNYKRALSATTEGWHKIVLPDELFGKLNADFSDIRIHGITKSKDTITAPYLLREAAENTSTTGVAASVINQSGNAKGWYFTFDIAGARPINEIKPVFKQDNFDWRIQLEGSQDQQEWFTLLNNYRILSISNALTDFRFTALRFPEAKYRYYRMLVPGKETPVLRSVETAMQQHTAGIAKTYSVVSTEITQDQHRKQTIVHLRLSMPVPVSRVKVFVHDTIDYYRPVTLQYAADSVKTAEGWAYRFQSLATSTLTSVEPNQLAVATTVTDRLQLIIANQDNQPLAIDSLQVSGYEHALIVRFAVPAGYWLVYGNKEALPPDYDISRFTDKIPPALTPLQLGEETAIAKTAPVVNAPLFQNKAWLWGLMLLIIVTIGGFSLNMIKRADSK